MRKNHSKLRKVLPLVLGLAVGGAGVANADTWLRTDSIALTNYLQTITLTPDSKKDLAKLVENQNAKVIDPREGVKNILTYIEKVGPYSENEKAFLIGRYQKFLRELEKEKPDESYNSSLKLLNEAVKDRVLDSQGDRLYEDNRWKIKPGKYMIKYGNDKWSVPVFVDIKLAGRKKLEKEIVLPLPKVQEEKKYVPCPYLSKVEIKEKEEDYELPLPEVKKEECKKGIITYTEEMPEVSLQPPYSICKEKKLPLPETPKAAEIQKEKEVSKALTPYAEVSEPEKAKVVEVPKEKRERESFFSLIAQGASNIAFDAYTGSLGARYNFNKYLGLGLNLDVGFGLDKLVDSYSGPLSCGRIAVGSVTDTNKFSIGGSLEGQIGLAILGAGVDYKTWMTKTVEQIIMEGCGNVLKSNTNTTPNRQIFAKVYGGVEIPITENWKLGAIAGYNWKDGMYAGLRTGFRLNNYKKKK